MDPDLANQDALTIFINHRVFDYEGNYIGAIGVGLTIRAVLDLIGEYQEKYNRGRTIDDGRQRTDHRFLSSVFFLSFSGAQAMV